MCPSRTLFPSGWTLPVSPLPPWHFPCPHIRISGAPAVEHEPFLFFTLRVMLKGTSASINLYLGQVSRSGDSQSNVNMILRCWGKFPIS